MHIPNAATIILDPLGPLVNFGGFFSSKTGFTSTNNSNNNSKLVSKGSAAPSGYVQSGKMGTLNKSSSAHSSQISLASLKKIDEHNSRDLLIPS